LAKLVLNLVADKREKHDLDAAINIWNTLRKLLTPTAGALKFAVRSNKGTPATSVEMEVLLCCARPVADSTTMARLDNLLQRNLDWPRLLRVATQHGLTPLMLRRLCALPCGRVPQQVLQRLRESSQSVVWHNLLLAGELIKLLDLFQQHGIAALPYKGPSLAVAAYGDLSLRHFNDLDILMPKAHILAAKDILMSLGYQPQQQLANHAEEMEHLQWDCQYNFFHPEDILVELHWRIRSRNFPFGARFDDLCKRKVRTSLAGASVETIAPEDLVIMLCVHGAKHRWDRLNWICDIAHLMEREKALNWSRIWDEATRLRCERVLLLGLLLACDLLGAELPDGLRRHARHDRVAHWLSTQVRSALFNGANSVASDDGPADGTFDAITPGALRRFLFQLAVRKPVHSKVQYLTYLLRTKIKRPHLNRGA
jgi:hypothetical protein